jgi:catechol 2,3-dioxygenase-like lactoylglutathione lyase family enzyme
MKRFHVHVSVENLDQSIGFYSKLFGQKPTKEKSDYAKWMLDDPRVNFAISTRSKEAGLDHFGFQVESDQELQELKKLADAASNNQVLTQNDAVCCYANSEKHWTIDPQGIAWEHFHTLSEAKTFGSDKTESKEGACCVPPVAIHQAKVAQAKSSSCGTPKTNASKGSSCC